MAWTQLSTLQQVFWVLAVLASVFFGVSSLLSFAGVGDANFKTGLDAHTDSGVDSDGRVPSATSSVFRFSKVERRNRERDPQTRTSTQGAAGARRTRYELTRIV